MMCCPFAPDIEPVERLDRAGRLARGRAEGGEVVKADEQLRGFVHRIGIKFRSDAPDAAALKRQRGAAVEDSIFVGATDAAVARVPFVAALARTSNTAIGMRAQLRIDRLHDAKRAERLFDIDMRAHAECVDPGIGAAGAVDERFFAP